MNDEKIESTICIIGAGPSGAATSIFLSKMGIEHIIVDAATFPRDKVCGDGLDMKTIRMLHLIDPAIIKEEIYHDNINFAPSWGMRSISAKGVNRDFAYQPTSGEEWKCPFFVSKRFFFDDFLVKKLDSKTAAIRFGAKVTKIVRDGKQWKVFANKGNDQAIEITCKLIVGADGDHSVVLRHLGDRKINRQHYAGSVRQYWKNIEGIHEKKLLEFYYPSNIPMGYFWIFPLANGEANVGYGIPSAIAAKNNLNIKQIFRELIEKDAALAPRFKNATPIDSIQGWGIPLASLKRKVVGDGWLLVGDAASMVSPNTGEGIGTGMMTGYIAAKFIERAIKLNQYDEQVLGNYSREVYKRLSSEIRHYNFYYQYPGVSNFIINHLISDSYLNQKGFDYLMKGWLNTAYNASLTVNLD